MKCILRNRFGNYKRGDILDLPEAEVKSLASHGVVRPIGRDSHGHLEKLGKFLQCVAKRDTGTLAAEHGSLEVKALDQISQKAALNEGSGITGGYAVPASYLPHVMTYAYDGIVRPRAHVLPMATRTLQVPVCDPTKVPAVGDTAFWGTMKAQWLNTELPAGVPESEPVFSQTELIAHELCGYAKASKALIEDAEALGILLSTAFGQAVQWYEDKAYLLGTGVGMPQGCLTSGAALSVTRQTAGTFTQQDAATMISKLPTGFEKRLDQICWVCHPSIYAKAFQFAAAASEAHPHLSLQDGRLSILGITARSHDAMSPLGTARDVALCDFWFYMLADRELMDIAYSDQSPLVYNTRQGLWRWIVRVDAQPWIRGPLTLSDGSQASPFVYLT
jgi:HK97 family phage major capsid protein